ncbi:pentatricopeptide repeat-containing protein [Canna indica]|uniref:Pentatricopeptide repeat-containing protein n=1 Tax=Canna indica TaxID=4628 RepID=A0AAQ3KRC9_9LILI|nr:pentatricopeptide repeat-containing protein [Canna indica]
MAAVLRRTLGIPLFHSHLSTLSTSPVADPNPSSSKTISTSKSAILSESDPDRLASLFESATRYPSFRNDRLIYHISIRKLAKHRRPDLIERLLEAAKSDPKAPKSEGFHVRLLSLYADAGMLDHAVRTFEAMPGLGRQRSERSLCALLSAFLKNGRFDRLQDAFYRASKEFGITPGVSCYNMLLEALCSSNEVEKARTMLDEMPKKGTKPNIICHNSVLNGYLKKGDFAGFEEVLEEIKTKKFKLNVGTYNIKIAALCAQGKSFQAEELLNVMKSDGIEPSRISFNTLINGFIKEGNINSAMQVFERMKGTKMPKGSGISPNLKTYIMLLQGLVEEGEFEKAVGIYKECLNKKWPLPFQTVKVLIEGLAKNSQVDEAKYVIEWMRKAVRGKSIDDWRRMEEALSL